MVNIVLSGDNAVVIAMASRCLPSKEQKLAVVLGCGVAVVLRILLTVVAVILLEIPYLQFAGGLLLVWIAAKLLMEEEEEGNIEGKDRLWPAVWTIVTADLIMSLDNTLALAAVANGNILLLIIGLALSVPLIIFGAQLIVFVMEKFPIIVYAGAGLIAWTAGEMMVRDPKLGENLLKWTHFEWMIPAVITLGVVLVGYYWKHFRKPRLAEEEV